MGSQRPLRGAAMYWTRVVVEVSHIISSSPIVVSAVNSPDQACGAVCATNQTVPKLEVISLSPTIVALSTVVPVRSATGWFWETVFNQKGVLLVVAICCSCSRAMFHCLTLASCCLRVARKQ